MPPRLDGSRAQVSDFRSTPSKGWEVTSSPPDDVYDFDGYNRELDIDRRTPMDYYEMPMTKEYTKQQQKWEAQRRAKRAGPVHQKDHWEY